MVCQSKETAEEIMGIIKRKLIEFVLRDFYALKDLDLKEFKEGLAGLKAKSKMTSEPPRKTGRICDITKCSVEGYTYYRIKSRKETSDRKVMYIHGGGFFAEAFKAHWDMCQRLVDATGCEIYFPVYPLVPESSSKESHEMLLKVYKELLKVTPPDKITFIGDSAGGTLCLSLSMLIRDNGLPAVSELILISPGFGFREMTEEDNIRLQEIKKHDFMIGQFPVLKIAALWMGELTPEDYRTDVTRGSLEGLPHITMFSGTYDILNIPARHFVQRMKDEGHPYLYEEKDKGYHVYALSRSSRKEFELIASKVKGEDIC